MQGIKFSEPFEQELKTIIGYSRVLGIPIDSVMDMPALRFDVSVLELSELLHEEQLKQNEQSLRANWRG